MVDWSKVAETAGRTYSNYYGKNKYQRDELQGKIYQAELAAEQFSKRHKLSKKYFKLTGRDSNKIEKSGKTSSKELQQMPKFKAGRYSKALKYKKKVPKYKKKTSTKTKKSFRRLDKEIRRVVRKTIDPKYEVGTYRYATQYRMQATALNQWTVQNGLGSQTMYHGGPQRVADAEAVLFNAKAVAAAGWNTGVGNFSYNHKVVVRSVNVQYNLTNDSQLRMLVEIYKFTPKKSTGVTPNTLWNTIYNLEANGTHTGPQSVASNGDYNAFHSDSEVLQQYFKCEVKKFDMMPGSVRHYNAFAKGHLVDWEKIVTAATSNTDPTLVTFSAYEPKIPGFQILIRMRPYAHLTTLLGTTIPTESGTTGGIAVESMTTIKIQCPEIAPVAQNVINFTSYNDFPTGALGTAILTEEDNPLAQVGGPA